MTKIVFRENRTENGYIQGRMPEMPSGSVLRRRFDETPKECSYTDEQNGNVHSIRRSFFGTGVKNRTSTTEQIDDRRSFEGAYIDHTGTCETSSRSRPANLIESIKGVPLWAVSAILCTIGILALFTPVLSIEMRYDNALMWSHEFYLIDLFDSQNQKVIARFTTAKVWMAIVPVIASCCMIFYYMLMRDRAYDRAYIPIIVSAVSFAMVTLFILDIDNVTSTFYGAVVGMGLLLMFFTNIILFIFGTVKLIVNAMKKRNVC